MSVVAADLVAYHAATQSDTDVGTVGGAIDLLRRPDFTQLAANDDVEAVSSSAGATTQTVTITARTAGVMALWSGVVPTASLGHLIATNGTYVVQGSSNILALQFIREAGADSTLIISLEKYAG